MKKPRLYLWLCGVNLLISAFTFGGGYVVVPMIKKYYVTQKHLFTEPELMEMAAIAQSSPGAIAINLSILAGKRAAGTMGVLISGVCSLIPPITILSFVSQWYAAFSANPYLAAVLKGMQACVAAMMADLILNMYQAILKEKSALLCFLAPAAFIACFFLNINVILILLASSLLCLLTLFWKLRFGKEEPAA